ncbi:histidinol-phosphate aminotransferase [Psychromonas sp. CNPT3]|uniref:histidinol-phosphate transaminase n=1 Tax=Psychromonas sp. CNPT3 TaxID=314282 RepID=UPI00006E76AD|nr:histidinol-phosphate transaminase [Psychromonas sp. CNPT3]AGH80610.1 histidinol-phosphate aminotransferase [Psychromonas sp. CNPT3]
MSTDFLKLANVGVQKLHPYQPGKPSDELAREMGITDIVKLASNENPLGVSIAVKKGLIECIDELSLYPDANGHYLKQALADKYALKAAQVTLGNGSNDLLEMLTHAFVCASDEVIFAQYSFVVYGLLTQSIGARAVVVPAREYGHDLEAMLDAITPRTKLVFIANPNNPTGTFLKPDALKTFISRVPTHVLVVLDEAYFEYVNVEHAEDSSAWIVEFPNLIVLRTFSKAYGLAGLRIGYSLSNSSIAEILNRIRQPFNCNALALKAAFIALNDRAYLQQTVALNNAGMKNLSDYFKRSSLDFIASEGNFIMVDVQRSADDVYQALLKEGVIVRPLGPYGLKNHLRVSIGTETQNQRFKGALTHVLK